MTTGAITTAVAGRLEPIRSISPADWLKITIISALVSILFAKILAGMAEDWWNEPAWSQGILLPPLALYIAWINRDRTFLYPPVADGRGIVLSGLACLTLLLGLLSSEFFLTRIAFVILLAGLTWTFWGLMRLRTLTFPLLLLATMVPLPVIVYNSLAAPLQLVASDLATQAAQLCGISVFRDGNIIHLAGTSLGVAEACSGLNSLSALIVGSLLLGYITCSRFGPRLILFLIAPPLAIAVNIVRVSGTALIADYDQEFAIGFYHSFSGWLVFVAGFAALYMVARFLHVVLDPK